MSEDPAGNKNEGAVASDTSGSEILPRKFGKYTLLRKLAAGGMAELFLALHRSMAGFEKLVVIKRVLPELAKDTNFITMLLQEARIAATFSHPNIVTIFDVGQVGDTYFIAMEHIHGEDLRSIVRAMKPKGLTEFPLEHAISIVQGVAAGLAYAHDKKDLNGKPLDIVHRDISPQNVLVTYTGDVKVVDFGIAKAARVRVEEPQGTSPGVSKPRVESNENLTKAGQLKGKVPYMSPEQARGDELDARSDLFSLGVILFELCTGRRLFRGPNEMETLRMITDGEYPRPSQVHARISPALERVIMKALEKDHTKRYQHARELQADLEAVAREERIPLSSLALANWMQMLFEERLAAQREALSEGKQLADIIAAEELPEQNTNVTPGAPKHSLVPREATASRTPWLVTSAVLALVVFAAGGMYVRAERAAAAERAVRSGVLSVRSEPAGARIWLNDAPTSFRTPHEFTDLATGADARYAVRLTLDGYEALTREIALPTAGARASVEGTLSRAQAQGFAVLELTTTPAGASVLLDGRAISGVTPLTIPELAPGVEHVAVVRHPDMIEETVRFTAAAGQVEHQNLTLRERPLGANEAFVSLRFDPPNARVRVAGRELSGPSPLRVRVSTTAPQTIAFSASGHRDESITLRPRAGETLEPPVVHLARARTHSSSNDNNNAAPVDRRPGALRIGASPWCNAVVDGRAIGQTPVDIESIAGGTHTIVCTNPTHGARTQRVTVTPGQLTPVRFRFP